jgi:hypothetical protein
MMQAVKLKSLPDQSLIFSIKPKIDMPDFSAFLRLAVGGVMVNAQNRFPQPRR